MPWRWLRPAPTVADPFPKRRRTDSPPGRQTRSPIEPTSRRPRTRRPLPDGRSVVGGLLVATAMVGTWWLASGSDAGATTRFVVASRTIDPGHRFERDDLRLVAMDLAPSVRASAYTEPGDLVDAVSLGPLAPGALVQEAAITTTARPSSREFSFAVETPWAVDGALRPGDRIDVLATEADGGRTTKVLADAVVRHVSTTGGGLGESTGLTITVAVDSAARLEGAVSALRGSELTVARTTGATGAEAEPDGERPGDRGAEDRGPTTTVATRTTRPGTTTTTRSNGG